MHPVKYTTICLPVRFWLRSTDSSIIQVSLIGFTEHLLHKYQYKYGRISKNDDT